MSADNERRKRSSQRIDKLYPKLLSLNVSNSALYLLGYLRLESRFTRSPFPTPCSKPSTHSSITAKSAGYAASVLSGAPAPPSPSGPHNAPSVHPDPVIAGILANLHSSNAAIQGIQSLLQGQQKTGGGGGGGGNKKRAAGGSGGAAVSPSYCWTHGCIGHASPACLHKKPNHMDAATYTNQMRGKPA